MAKRVSVGSGVGGKRRKRGQRINLSVLIYFAVLVTLFSLAMNVVMFHRFNTLRETRASSGDGAPVRAPDVGEAASEDLVPSPPQDGGTTTTTNRLLSDRSCGDWDTVAGVSLTTKEHVKAFPAGAPQHIGSSISGAHSAIIDLDHGDPTMYEPFWRAMAERGSIVVPGWQAMSYFSRAGALCWFMEPRLGDEIVRLHNLVGNARTAGRHIIVGTGSTQLFQAALYALSPLETEEPISVVSAAPYYSSYPAVTDFLRSGLYRWAGDAYAFREDAPYIELVCSPNNPDGFLKEAVVNREKGKAVYDLAYYWPQYTPITAAASHDIMLFTFSKITGHAGTRIGWALVKDRDIAQKMTKFIELNTIGVSKDSQLRAAQILEAVSDGYELRTHNTPGRFFDYGRRLMAERWERLREAVRSTGRFGLPDFPSADCSFTAERTQLLPAFAWLKCESEDVEDCQEFLKSHKILTRSGRHFGSSPNYVRVSMLDTDENFNLFIRRLFSIG